MEVVRNMVESHPTFNGEKLDEIEKCITECLACASACTICADACLSKENSDLNTCIKNNLMCANICETTARMLSFENKTSGAVSSLLEACKKICEVCAQECQQHAENMRHCEICAKACKDCIQSCDRLLSA